MKEVPQGASKAHAAVRRLLESNGGNGTIRFTSEGGSTYQITVVNYQVVGVTRGGEYQPRFVAEEVVREFAQGKGQVEWVPFFGYYPPIHILFYIPLNQGENSNEGGKEQGLGDDPLT